MGFARRLAYMAAALLLAGCTHARHCSGKPIRADWREFDRVSIATISSTQSIGRWSDVHVGGAEVARVDVHVQQILKGEDHHDLPTTLQDFAFDGVNCEAEVNVRPKAGDRIVIYERFQRPEASPFIEMRRLVWAVKYDSRLKRALR